jgi:hypothetical protein
MVMKNVPADKAVKGTFDASKIRRPEQNTRDSTPVFVYFVNTLFLVQQKSPERLAENMGLRDS